MMMRRAGLFFALLILVSTCILPEPARASNGNAHRGCAWIDHQGTSGHNYYKVSTEASPTASASCTDQSSYTLTEGNCLTWKTAFATTGGTPPTSPTGIIVYVYADTQNLAQGAVTWATPVYSTGWTSTASFNGQTISLCGTTTGQSGGTAAPGTYRVVIRVCQATPVGTDGCGAGGATTLTYHISSDSTGNSPGTGNSVAGISLGGYVSMMAPASWVDSTTLGGSDVSKYVGGEAITQRLADKTAIANTGIENVNLVVVGQDGSTLTSTASATLRTSTNADATHPVVTVTSATYPNGTSPTKRATITANSALLNEPWTYFASAPTGATLTSSTQIDAALGAIDTGLSFGPSCYVQNPDTGNTVAFFLHRYQTILDRSCILQNGRGENIANGAFIRTFHRNSNLHTFGDTTDAASCDATVGASGAWTCDANLNGNSAATFGRPFVLDVAQYSSSGRTTTWAQGTLAMRFDVTTTTDNGPVANDPNWMTAYPIVPVGSSQNLTIRMTYDNGTARPGAAANATINCRAPDGSWVVNQQHPTEDYDPSNTARGYYWVSFNVAQEGGYKCTGWQITELNEQRNAFPVAFVGIAYPASQNQLNSTTSSLLSTSAFAAWNAGEFRPAAATLNDTNARLAYALPYLAAMLNLTSSKENATGAQLTYYGDGIFAVVNGSLSAAEFRDWKTGEARVMHATVNGTATQASLTYYGSGIFAVSNLTYSAADATRIMLQYFGPGIYSVVNGTLQASEFRDWKTGEARPMWLAINGTATQASLTYYGSGLYLIANSTHDGVLQVLGVVQTIDANQSTREAHTWSLVTAANLTVGGALTTADFTAWNSGEFRPTSTAVNLTQSEVVASRADEAGTQEQLKNSTDTLSGGIHADGAQTRRWMPTKWIHDAWTTIQPRSRDAGVAFVSGASFLAVALIPHSIFGSRGRRSAARRADSLFAALLLLGAFAWVQFIH